MGHSLDRHGEHGLLSIAGTGPSLVIIGHQMDLELLMVRYVSC